MILQTIWNKCVRFFVHIDIEVSYKILWLKVLKEVPILHNSPCFHLGLFCLKKTPRTLGVKRCE
jgi:hypothetical protein